MRINLLHLRPTQMALGMKEIEFRVKKLEGMKDKERERYLKAHRIPVVFGPHGKIYLVDHHHLIRACWEAGHLEVPVEIKKDFRGKSFRKFWRTLRQSHWIRLYDQFGNGPHDPIDLPENIKGLADDPYRSLAWFVREEGGYRKTRISFAEFKWADFFRARLNPHPVFHGLGDTLTEAMKLAQSHKARHLPGYIR